MGKEIPPFSFSVGERKIMAHFVVNKKPGPKTPAMGHGRGNRHTASALESFQSN